MKFFHSVRTTLTLWYAGILTVTLLGSGVSAYFITRATMLDNLDRSLRNEVKWVNEFIEPKAKRVRLKRAALRELEELKRTAAAPADTLEETSDVSPKDRAVIDEMWNQIYQHTLLSPRRHLIQILDRNGDLLYRSQTLRTKDIRYDDIPYQWINVVTTRMADGSEVRLALMQTDYVKIFVAYPVEPVFEALDNVFGNVILIIPLALLISVIGGWFLAHKSLRPVDELTRAARDITAQNLNRRLPTHRVDDELGRLTAQFNDMIGRLEESFAQIQQFSADASHELRTPLTIMRGEVEVALRNGRHSRATRELLLSLHHELIRLSSIVESLMILIKSDAGRQVFRFEPVMLDILLRQLTENAGLLAEPKKVRVRAEQIDEITIPGDEARLRQLFLNLLDNAVKYTQPRGSVIVSLIRDGNSAVITVKDTGIGIPRKDHGRIFERFYRVDRPGRTGGEIPTGSGLGLPIAKWITEAHHGTILVQSRDGRGTTFVVRLPIS
jgi:heavy metal sensor kinase